MTNQATNSTQPSLRALIADDAYSMTFQSLPQYRAALLQSLAAFANQPAPTVPADYVLMPRCLTAENRAKGALSGEFVESFPVACHECDGVGEVDDGFKCAECDGDGQVEQRVMVEWDTIKRIYGRAVALLAHQPAQEQAEPGAGVTLEEALYALDLVTNKMHVPGLSGQHAFAAKVLQRAAQKEAVAPATDAQCTCPSGNGSLRWPCPAHPPGLDKVHTDGKCRAATQAAAQGEKA
jgi:hypothetical protein